jgi:hypothetical protein
MIFKKLNRYDENLTTLVQDKRSDLTKFYRFLIEFDENRSKLQISIISGEFLNPPLYLTLVASCHTVRALADVRTLPRVPAPSRGPPPPRTTQPANIKGPTPAALQKHISPR